MPSTKHAASAQSFDLDALRCDDHQVWALLLEVVNYVTIVITRR
jgi:hypothetical protein